MRGLVSNCQRYSMFDGYGLRTVVFLMGCTLRCAWCQNPENLEQHIALLYAPDACVRCGACTQACPNGAAAVQDGRIVYDRSRCGACMQCVPECYYGARKPSGTERDAEDVVREVLRDKAFFLASGGGVTLSGGEPLMQAAFAEEILRGCKAEGLHTAIETAGNVPWSAFERVLPWTDLFLFDIKLADAEKHRRWTGSDNRRILDNFRRLCGSGKEVIVRVPLIPGVNDGAEFDAIVELARGDVGELHILPYHDLGRSKYEQLGIAYPMADAENTDGEIRRCERRAEDAGLRVSVGGAGFCREQ